MSLRTYARDAKISLRSSLGKEPVTELKPMRYCTKQPLVGQLLQPVNASNEEAE